MLTLAILSTIILALCILIPAATAAIEHGAMAFSFVFAVYSTLFALPINTIWVLYARITP